jgi:hypothetical protein
MGSMVDSAVTGIDDDGAKSRKIRPLLKKGASGQQQECQKRQAAQEKTP